MTLKAKFGKVRFAVFWDNAQMHKADDVRNTATDLDIPLIYNIPYCPQYNGLENMWMHTKAAFKTLVTQSMYAGKKWSNADFVPRVTKAVPKEVIIKGLQRGLENLVNA